MTACRKPLGRLALAVTLSVLIGPDTARADWENPADRYLDAYKPYEAATCPLADSAIKHFVYFARDRESLRNHPLLRQPKIRGAQVMYIWSELEPRRDEYDFASIDEDLQYLEAHGKTLFVQLQDATFYDRFQPAPDYLRSPEFDGGVVAQRDDDGEAEGWVVKRWNPAVRARFAKLLAALGERFDGRVEGLNLQESAIGVTPGDEPGFTAPIYVESLRANMRALKNAFPNSTTLLYANFMPGEWLPWEDEGYLRSIYRYGEEIGVGLGAPDLMVRRKGQLNHALAMMHENDFSVPLGIAIQDGNYIGHTGADGSVADQVRPARRNLVPMLYEFARDFLEVDYLFWVNQVPYFEEDVLPCLSPASAEASE